MDKFFKARVCCRCGGSLEGGRIMSRFNTDVLCMKCSEAERKRPDYEEARKAEEREIMKGNYYFKGIGY